MYLVTGGAGFIGSNLVAALAARGEEVAVCDWMRQRRTMAQPRRARDRRSDSATSVTRLAQPSRGKLKAMLQMGAISTTTETDVDAIADNNIRATLDLAQWCTETETRFIYASSAATYGDGSAGFDDDSSPAALAVLRPLNAYGWSKHVIERRIARLRVDGAEQPPQCVGMKLINVYGPNEYHKGNMKSVIAQNFAKVQAGEPLRLFRSYRPDYPDGGQLRDFIYVRDCVDVMLWLLDQPTVSGLFNVGTGKARTWLDVARALFGAMGREPNIEFIEMPPQLIEKYQYFTEAKMGQVESRRICQGIYRGGSWYWRLRPNLLGRCQQPIPLVQVKLLSAVLENRRLYASTQMLKLGQRIMAVMNPSNKGGNARSGSISIQPTRGCIRFSVLIVRVIFWLRKPLQNEMCSTTKPELSQSSFSMASV